MSCLTSTTVVAGRKILAARGRKALPPLLAFISLLFFPRLLLAAAPAKALSSYLAAVPEIHYTITGRLPHDPQAFTQGLLFFNGLLYESTGLYGASSLRIIDPRSGTILKRRSLAATDFGEGLAIFDRKLIQLTWRKGTAYVYNAADLSLLHSFTYTGEGWGLTADDHTLYMSDGSSEISLRSPADFTQKGRISVRAGEHPVTMINELELAGNVLYANIWQENYILRIDPGSGEISGYLDTSGLSWPSKPEGRGEKVANGIAFDADGNLFYLTGKNWPFIFVVTLTE